MTSVDVLLDIIFYNYKHVLLISGFVGVFIMAVIVVALAVSGLTAVGVGLVAVWAKFCDSSCDVHRFIRYIWGPNEEKTSLMKTDYVAAYQVSTKH